MYLAEVKMADIGVKFNCFIIFLSAVVDVLRFGYASSAYLGLHGKKMAVGSNLGWHLNFFLPY